MQCYHVTPDENFEGIVARGLQLAKGPRSIKLGEPDQGIFLFRDRESLEQGLLSQWMEDFFDYDKPLVCLVVDIDGLKTTFNPDAGFEIICNEPVDVDRIRLLSFDILGETDFPDEESARPLREDSSPEPC